MTIELCQWRRAASRPVPQPPEARILMNCAIIHTIDNAMKTIDLITAIRYGWGQRVVHILRNTSFILIWNLFEPFIDIDFNFLCISLKIYFHIICCHLNIIWLVFMNTFPFQLWKSLLVIIKSFVTIFIPILWYFPSIILCNKKKVILISRDFLHFSDIFCWFLCLYIKTYGSLVPLLLYFLGLNYFFTTRLKIFSLFDLFSDLETEWKKLIENQLKVKK